MHLVSYLLLISRNLYSVKSDHIAKVLQSCQDDLNTAMEVFQVRVCAQYYCRLGVSWPDECPQMKSAITISRRQTEVELENKQVQDEMLTLLRTIVHTHTKGDTAIDVVRKGRRVSYTSSFLFYRRYAHKAICK